jgi:hypothetical protein
MPKFKVTNPQIVEQVVEKEVIKEVPVIKEVVVEKEVIKEVPVHVFVDREIIRYDKKTKTLIFLYALLLAGYYYLIFVL